MNRTIRNLALAVPLATAAITLTPAVASAVDPNPVIVQPPAQPDPPKGGLDIAQPKPGPVKPKGPGDIAQPKPGPVDPKGPGDIAQPEPGDDPKGPGDIANPTPGPDHPKGPGDLTSPKPCPTHGVDCGHGGGKDGGTSQRPTSHQPRVVVESVALPTRVDAGMATSQHDASTMPWLFAGGALLTVAGGAFAARRRARSNA